MKVLAYYPLHYGMEYLDASIRSVAPYVDKIIILYAAQPSFGHHTDTPCPEPEWVLRAIAEGASDKVQWVQTSGTSEGNHRDQVMPYAEGYDLLLAVDADEVWMGAALEDCLWFAYHGTAHRYNIEGFVNFWKSFNYICTDGFTPARIFNLNCHNQEEENLPGRVYHFGYAQRREIIAYKMCIHGHRDIRPEWLDIYLNWTPESRLLHPASRDIWVQAEPFDKTTLPDILKTHPNYNKEII